VYRATIPSRRDVAIKVLRRLCEGPERVARSSAKARTLDTLNNPNIAGVCTASTGSSRDLAQGPLGRECPSSWRSVDGPPSAAVLQRAAPGP
jgi:hypothetical protein